MTKHFETIQLLLQDHYQRPSTEVGIMPGCLLFIMAQFPFTSRTESFWKMWLVATATVKNPRGSVEKLSPKESVEGGNTALRGSVRAPKGFSEGQPEAAKPRVRNPKGFAAKGLPEVIVIPLCPKDFQQLLRLPNS